MFRFYLLAASFLPITAQAASLQGDLKGLGLNVSLSCARHIVVTADAGLPGQVGMDAVAENPEEIAQIDFVSDSTVKLKAHGRCWPGRNPGNYQPTLDITLHVPAAFPLSIDAAGSTNYGVAVGGPLAFDLSGSGQLHAGKVTTLSMDLSGSGAAQVDEVAGSISLDLSGSAKLSIGQAESVTVAAEVSGSGHVRIEQGHVGKLTVSGSGSGDVAVGGIVDDATIDLSGSGGVTIGKLTGKLVEDTSGSGVIRVVSR